MEEERRLPIEPVGGHKDGHRSYLVQAISVFEHSAREIIVWTIFIGVIGDQRAQPTTIRIESAVSAKILWRLTCRCVAILCMEKLTTGAGQLFLDLPDVIPAKAGIHSGHVGCIPAFAGMTIMGRQ